MAKCTVTFVDKPDGEVVMNVEFDPPAKRDEDLTPAQSMACQLVLKLQKENEGD